MAGSVRATVLGLDYQHRSFWIEACRLFFESPLVQRVALEKKDLRAFDDVVTSYSQPIPDTHGRPIDGDHLQLKFHVSYEREIRGMDLIAPKFINATKVSLLERLAAATAGGVIARRMTLITPHDIDNSDPLRFLISPRSGDINLDPLFDTRANRDMRDLREAWRTALGNPTDDRLREILRHLRIRANVPMYALDDKLAYHLERAGLEPLDLTSMSHRYVGLAQAFITARMWEHDRVALEAVLRREKLWIGRPAPDPDRPKQLGIKSFSPFAYELEDEALVLNLLPFFHGRYTAADVEWDRDLFPSIRDFLVTHVRSGDRYDLHLDTHLSVAFAAGYVLDKADALITPIQRFPNGGRIAWASSGETVEGPLWEPPRTINVGEGPEVALAIEVTHPVAEDVAIYAKRALPAVGEILVMTIAGGPSRTSVRDGDHAHALATSVASDVQASRRAEDRRHRLHVFAAAPGGLMFLIGRAAAPWGPTITYEYDFDRRAPGAYGPAFHLPPDAPTEMP